MRVESDERLWKGWPGAKAPGYVRAFGNRGEDLDLDFTGLPRPDLVSAVLLRCLRSDNSGRSDDEEIWSWTLAQRLQGLLAVTRAGDVPPLSLLQQCKQCGATLELDVDVGMFEREESVVDFECSPQEDHTLRVALPTGREQRTWSSADGLTMRTMARALIREVDGTIPSDDWEIPDAWVDPLANELEARDPLTALELETHCPTCDSPASIPLDLEAELLASLQYRQQRTLDEIHRLASVYHWSESTILELPAWRRRYYLSQLGGEENL